MKIKIVTIEIPTPRWLKRSLLAAATFASLVGIGLGGQALAEPVPTAAARFTDGEVLSAAKLNSNFAVVAAAVQQINDPKCPIGYAQDTMIAPFVVCKKGGDEVVKVGAGGAAFWIDRYEASVWSNAGGTGTQYGATNSSGALVLDYPTTFPKNGQRSPSFMPLYATSKAGVQPSASLTWLQAVEACAASGKRLPDGQEWLRAASGTNDPGSSSGGSGACVTSASGPRAAGTGTSCLSVWGAQDMIGSEWEWTNEHYAGLGNATPTANWPDTIGGLYYGDGTANIASTAVAGTATATLGLPSASLRGGNWKDGTRSGVNAQNLTVAVSYTNPDVGFRCLLPK